MTTPLTPEERRALFECNPWPAEDSALGVVSNPETPGEVLRAAWKFVRIVEVARSREQAERPRAFRAALYGNPNLPADLLREALLDGILAAWLNPATPLHLLECPIPDEERIRALWKVLCAMVGRPDMGHRRIGKIDRHRFLGRQGFRALREAFPDDVASLIDDG